MLGRPSRWIASRGDATHVPGISAGHAAGLPGVGGVRGASHVVIEARGVRGDAPLTAIPTPSQSGPIPLPAHGGSPEASGAAYAVQSDRRQSGIPCTTAPAAVAEPEGMRQHRRVGPVCYHRAAPPAFPGLHRLHPPDQQRAGARGGADGADQPEPAGVPTDYQRRAAASTASGGAQGLLAVQLHIRLRPRPAVPGAAHCTGAHQHQPLQLCDRPRVCGAADVPPAKSEAHRGQAMPRCVRGRPPCRCLC
mmetsp:Transcript_16188/g.48496  ORF Transcript_16188/g.48496 Transcript_16188/m.48496 type:complete len:250 (+) Transcript_16188:683-1432(+)